MWVRRARSVGWGRSVAWIVVLGLLIRYVLAPYTSAPQDVATWEGSAVASMHHLGLYQRPGFSYPPVWGYLLRGIATALSLAGINPSALGQTDPTFGTLSAQTNSFSALIPSPLFNVAYKTVLFIFDLGTSMLLYRAALVFTQSRTRATIAFASWFLNPFVIYESAVHGAFDGIVAFFIVAGVALMLAGRFAWSGAALAAGMMTKLTPLLLLPLFLLFAFLPGRPGAARRINVRAAGLVALGFAATLALALVPALAAGEIRGMLESVFSRGGTSITVGGLSLWGLTRLSASASVFWWAIGHPVGVRLISLVGVLVGVSAVTLVSSILLRRRDWEWGLVTGSGGVLGVALLFAPLTQPQYLEWMLPLVILVVVAAPARAWQLIALSGSPIVMSLGYLGPIALVAPLSEWTRVIAPADVAASVANWFARGPGKWGTSYKDDYGTGADLLALPAMVAVVLSSLRIRTRRRFRDDAALGAGTTAQPELPGYAQRGSTDPVQGRSASRLGTFAITALAASLVAVGAGEALSYAPWRPRDVTHVQVGEVAAMGGGTQVTGSVSLASDENGVRLLAVPVSTTPVDRQVTIYIDPRYPMSGSDLRTTQGVFDHLSAELAIRRYPHPVTSTDATGLRNLFDDIGQASSRAVVVTTGVLPATVFSRQVDLVKPWVDAGGLLIWGGAPIGYYSGRPGGVLDPADSRANLRDLGPVLLLGPGTVNVHYAPGRQAAVPSAIASALDLEYRSTSGGVLAAAVGTAGATILGWADDFYSSLTSFGVGRGTILVFGGDIFDEVAVAHDLTLVLMTNVLDASGPLAYRDVSGHASAVTPFRLSVPGVAAGLLSIAAFDPAPEGVYLSTTVRRVQHPT